MARIGEALGFGRVRKAAWVKSHALDFFIVPSVVDIASILMAYAFLGRADVVAALHTHLGKKPFWALQPTLSKKLIHGAMWPLSHILCAYLGHPPGRRIWAVAVAIFKVAASWLFMSCMFSFAFVAAAFFYNQLLRDAAFVVLCSLLLPMASLVSPARKAFPPREKFEIRFPWRKRGRTYQRQVVDALASNAELSSDYHAPVEVIELLRIQAESLGWMLCLPDHNDIEDILLSKSNLSERYVRDNEKATLWTKAGEITLLRSGSWPAFGDFLELEEWLRNHPG